MSLLSNVKVQPIKPLLVGGISPNGTHPHDVFAREWRCTHLHNNIWLVGEKAPTGRGCFSLKHLNRGVYEIAYYYEDPKEVFDGLKNGSRVFDCEYHDSDPTNKYLCMDMLRILRELGL